MLITPIKQIIQIIHIKVSILMKRSLIYFKKFKEIYRKRSNYISF